MEIRVCDEALMTTTTSNRRSGASLRRKSRALALLPFVVDDEREQLRELEQMFVYGVQELFGLMGGVQVVDLGPSLSAEDLSRIRESFAPADVRAILQRTDARGLLSGGIDVAFDDESGRLDSVSLHLELRAPVGRGVDVTRFDFLVRNIAPLDEPERFVLDVDELLAAQREAFLGVKRRLGLRYCAGPERRKYYEYRLSNPMTRSHEAYRWFVRSRRMTSRREEKLVLYKRALRCDPCLGPAYRNVGYLYKEAKKLSTAIEYYRQAIRVLLDPETLADAHAELGLCYANQSEIDQALQHWHVSRRWNRENKDVYANLAIGYEEKGMIDKAIRYFLRAQQIDPNYYWACRGLGRIYAGQQDWNKAIEQLSIQLRIAPEDAWGHYTLGNCYFQQGNPSKARNHCRRAVELDPHGDAGRRAFQLLMQIES